MIQAKRREIKRPAETEGVVFLLYKNGRFLIEEVRRQDSDYFGHVRIPAGKIETGETPRAAMKREAKEELGITPKEFIELDAFENVTLNGNYYVFHGFLILDYEGEVKNQEPEKSNIQWVPEAEAWDILRLAPDRYLLSLSRGVITSEGQSKG